MSVLPEMARGEEMTLLKMTIKYGPLQWQRCLEVRDGAEFERYVSQLGSHAGDPEVPDRAWRELVVYAEVIEPPQWFTGWRAK
jgi:hypothetical protein